MSKLSWLLVAILGIIAFSLVLVHFFNEVCAVIETVEIEKSISALLFGAYVMILWIPHTGWGPEATYRWTTFRIIRRNRL